MVTVLVALTSTLVTIRLQSAQGMSIKQLSYSRYGCLSFLYCYLAWKMPLYILEIMNSVFYDMIDKYIFSYLDDILVYSQNAT